MALEIKLLHSKVIPGMLNLKSVGRSLTLPNYQVHHASSATFEKIQQPS